MILKAITQYFQQMTARVCRYYRSVEEGMGIEEPQGIDASTRIHADVAFFSKCENCFRCDHDVFGRPALGLQILRSSADKSKVLPTQVYQSKIVQLFVKAFSFSPTWTVYYIQVSWRSLT